MSNLTWQEGDIALQEQLAGIGSAWESKKSVTSPLLLNALKGKANGNPVVLDDVSAMEHKMNVQVSSKNLIPFPYNGTKFEEGMTLTDNGDGSITCMGTPTAYSAIVLYQGAPLVANGVVTFSGEGIGLSTANTTNLSLNFSLRDSSGATTTLTSEHKGYITVNLDEYIDIVWWQLILKRMSNKTVPKAVVWPQLEKGAIATSYTPYVPNVQAAIVKKQGKNMIKPWANYSYSEKGLDVTSNGNGAVVVNGTCTSAAWLKLCDNITLPAGTYALRGSPTTATSKTMFFYCFDIADNSKNLASDYSGTGVVFTLTKETEVAFRIYVASGVAMNHVMFHPQLTIGSTVTAYEPYIEPIGYIPTPDGKVENISSLYPTTVLSTDTEGVRIDCEYTRDINAAVKKLTSVIISLGGNI